MPTSVVQGTLVNTMSGRIVFASLESSASITGSSSAMPVRPEGCVAAIVAAAVAAPVAVAVVVGDRVALGCSSPSPHAASATIAASVAPRIRDVLPIIHCLPSRVMRL
jgi:hypothetical protein